MTAINPSPTPLRVAIDLDIAAAGWTVLEDAPNLVDEAALTALKTASELSGSVEISIRLGDDAEIARLNETWRGKANATNILSFPAAAMPSGACHDGERVFLGDMILAIETITREAEAQKKPFRHHFSHLIIHGILHLLGYDHDSDKMARQMQRMEIEIMRQLGLPDPYQLFESDN